ncbi:MAG: CAP domain-containing protein [Desulfomonilaceae bacterium]
MVEGFQAEVTPGGGHFQHVADRVGNSCKLALDLSSAQSVIADTLTAAPVDKAQNSLEKFLFEMTNAQRAKKNLRPLKPSTKMDKLAFEHSLDMCGTNLLAHESDLFPKGRRKFHERMAGIGVTSGAENIAFHSDIKDHRKLAQIIVDGWMKSSTHRKNILDERFSFIGLGAKACKNGLIYVTQLFSDGQETTRSSGKR